MSDVMWKFIPGYEGYYEVSNTGLIRSSLGRVVKNNGWSGDRVLKEKSIKPVVGKDGRERVVLCKNGTKKGDLLSRLVAITWVSGYQQGLTVNHINGDRRDNRVENLEWITREDNIRHGFNMGLYKSKLKTVVLTLRSNGEAHSFPSLSAASRWLGYGNGYLSNRIKKHERSGCVITYKDVYEVTV